MEFWGTEVLGKPLLVAPGDDTYLHVSQAALGPSKDNKPERVVIRVETDGKNIVLGTLVPGKVDQMALDLIFDREFALSHNSTSSSVFFCGYRTEKGGEEFTSDEEMEGEEDANEDDEEEIIPAAVPIKVNGSASVKDSPKSSKKAKAKEETLEPAVTSLTQLVKEKPKKSVPPVVKTGLIDHEALEDDDSDDDSEDEDEEGPAMLDMDLNLDDYDEEDDSEFEGGDDMSDDGSDEDDEDEEDSDDEDSDDQEDEDDAAGEVGKKRTLKASEVKSAATGKKARVDTPAKPGSNTAAQFWESLIVAGGQGLISTPGKKASAKSTASAKLTPVTSNKKSQAKETTPKPQKTSGKEASAKTPKSVTPGDSAKKALGDYHCADCKRNFVTESALTQHSAAKHKK